MIFFSSGILLVFLSLIFKFFSVLSLLIILSFELIIQSLCFFLGGLLGSLIREVELLLLILLILNDFEGYKLLLCLMYSWIKLSFSINLSKS